MITLEQYASVYLSLTMATGNAQKEQAIAASLGISHPELLQAKAYFQAQMVNPADGGRTAMAIAQAAQNASRGGQQLGAVPKRDTHPASFDATRLVVDHSEFDVLQVLWANDTTKQHLMIQMAYSSDEQERANGMDTFHIDINEQSYSMYGGVAAVDLRFDSVTFHFDQIGQNTMKIPSITIRYVTDGKMYQYLARKMQFIFKGVRLSITPQHNPSQTYVANGLQLNDGWIASKDPAAPLKLLARPNLQPFKASGRFQKVVFIDWKSPTFATNPAEHQAMTEMEGSLRDTLERDFTSIVAFIVTDPEKRRYYVYTALEQGAFMERINDALRLLPRLPLGFSGGEDAAWDNYQGVMDDLAAGT